MQMEINISEVREFVTSNKFTDFLVSNTTDIGVAAFVLQTLLDKLDEIKGE